MMYRDHKEWFDANVRRYLDIFVTHISCEDESISAFIKHYLLAYNGRYSVANVLVNYYKQTSDVYAMERL